MEYFPISILSMFHPILVKRRVQFWSMFLSGTHLPHYQTVPLIDSFAVQFTIVHTTVSFLRIRVPYIRYHGKWPPRFLVQTSELGIVRKCSQWQQPHINIRLYYSYCRTCKSTTGHGLYCHCEQFTTTIGKLQTLPGLSERYNLIRKTVGC
jgi:hypothetical protein